MEAADREGLQIVEALGYRSWRSGGDLPATLQQASYLEGGSLMWMLPLYMHINKKSIDDDDDFWIVKKHLN